LTDTLARLAAALADRYRIERELGRGGMATVYLAQDLKHDRQVAIKVLHEDLGAVLGAERFLTEIKTTAKLQHPHILPLLDSGEAGGLLFYVMPYITGETLRARLERETQLPVADALRIAREVADALAEAHGRGVVHRDIKPENILLQGSHALVADFGIALAVQHAGGARMTQTGLSLGTPQYMAPEQAMGDKAVDHRADIYALGAVTYEMLTGEPPHTGANVQAIVAKLLTEPVRPVRVLRPAVSEQVDATLRVALQKLPADRFATVAEFSEALRGGVMTERMSALLPDTSVTEARRPQQRLVAGAAVLALAAAALGWWAGRMGQPPATAPLPVTRIPLALLLPATLGSFSSATAISPDGSRLIVSALDSSRLPRLYSYSLADGQVATLDLPGLSQPAFSPDGRWVVAADGRDASLSLEPSGGGERRSIFPEQVYGRAAWLSDSLIAFSALRTLQTVHLGTLRRDTILDGGDTARFVTSRPGRVGQLLAVRVGPIGNPLLVQDGQIGVVSVAERRFTPLGLAGTRPEFVEPDIVTFSRDGTIWGVRVDFRTLQPRGEPVIIAGPGANGQVVSYAVSGNGVMLLRRGSGNNDRELLLADRNGRTRLARPERTAYRSVRFSTDGQRLLYSRAITASVGGDIFVLTLQSGALLRLTRDSINLAPEWGPGNRFVYYGILASADTGRQARIVRVPSTGGGTPEFLVARPRQIYEFQVAPDAGRIVWREDAGGQNRDIYVAAIDSATGARGLRVSPVDERGPALSPDGQWYLYSSLETGDSEIYLAKVDGDGSRWPVSVGGGTEPRWARNGEVFYRNGEAYFVTRITLGAEPRIATPRQLFTGSFLVTGYEALWDVSPDGQQFAFVRSVNSEQSSFELVLNWAQLLPMARR